MLAQPENDFERTVIERFQEHCEGYTAEDFTLSDKPYRFLADLAGSYPTYSSLLGNVLLRTAKAKGAPASAVRETIRAILRQIKRQAGTDEPAAQPRNDVSNSMSFADQPLRDADGAPVKMDIGAYIADGERIIEYRGKLVEQVISHPIMISRRFVDIEDGAEYVELSYKIRGEWKELTVMKGTITTAQSITALGNKGVDVTSESAKSLVRFLNTVDTLNGDRIPVSRIAKRVGWTEDGGFVPYTPDISYGGDASFTEMYNAIHERGSYDTWLEAVKRIRREKSSLPARVLMAASFASPLLKIFKALSFIAHIWTSESGTGKTVALELAASVWANPAVGAYVKNLSSTAVALEQSAGFTRHLPLILDELQTIQSKGDYQDIIYMLCEGHGKSRGAKNGGLRATPTWNNITITCGEMPIITDSSKAGAVNRVVEVHSEGALFGNTRQLHLTLLENYGFAGKRFVEALRDEETVKAAEAKLKEFEGALINVCTDKQALSASMLLLGDWLSEKLIFHDGVTISVSEIRRFLKTREDVDTNRRALDYVTGWIAENHNCFARYEKDGVYYKFTEKTELGNRLFGRIDADGEKQTVWIFKNPLESALRQAGFNFKSFKEWLRQNGLIVTSEKDYDMPRVKVSGVLGRALGLKIVGDSASRLEAFKRRLQEPANDEPPDFQ